MKIKNVTRAGRASIEIVADLSKFGAQLQKELNRVLRDIKLDLSPVAGQIGDSVTAGAREAERGLGGLDDAAERTARGLADVGDTAADAFAEIDAAAEAAYRKIEDDAREFERTQERVFEDLEAAAEEAFREVGDAAGEAGDQVGDQLGAGADKAKRSLKDMAAEAVADLRSVDVQIEQVERQIRELAREFARTGDVDVFARIREDKTTVANLRAVRAELFKVAEEADNAARQTKRFSEDSASGSRVARRALSGVVEVVTSLGSALIGLGASAPTPAGIVAIGLAVLALGAAIPVVIGLGAALANLAGLVVAAPAGIGVLVAALIPLKIAFLGVSDAIDAVLGGDPEQIAEALKGLAPAARSVVREFQSLLPSLRAVKRETQEAFFRPLRGVLTELARALLPTVRAGLKGVAGELGQLAAAVADMLKSPQGVKFISDAFATARRIIDRAKFGVEGFIDVIFTLGQKGLPLIEKLAGALFGAGEDLADFVSRAERSGGLDEFVSDAVSTFKDLLALVKSVGNFLSALFSRGEAEGTSFIRSLTDGFNAMAEALRSPEGQEFLQNMLDLLPFVIASLATTLQILAAIGIGLNKYIDFVKMMIRFWGEFISIVGDAGAAIGNAFVTAYDAVVAFFVGVGEFFGKIPGWVADFASAVGSGIAGAFTAAYNAVVGFFTAVGQFFVELPGRTIDLLAAFGSALVTGIKIAFDTALQAIGVAIGLILFNIFVLPGLVIDALMALPGLLADFFTTTWSTVSAITVAAFALLVSFAFSLPGRIFGALVALYGMVTGLFSRTWDAARSATVAAFNAVVAFAFSLPGRIGAGLNALYGIITGAFSRSVSAGRSIVVNGFNSIVSWIAGVPSRISSLGGRFLSAGKSIMQGFFNGLKSAGGMAGDVGAAIYRSVKGFLNSAIRSINSGIDRVDAVLPGSLPRIPQLQRGGMTLGPTLAALSETGRREVVLPVEDPRTMAALRDALGIGRANGPAVVFETGAIAVTFTGVVPTEQEAYRTGRAVADGIADTLSRSDVATQIRTM